MNSLPVFVAGWRGAIRGLVWLAAGSLAGCSGFSAKPVAPPLAQSRQALYQLAVWKLEGRIGVKTPDEGWSASLFWEHDGGQDRLLIAGPFSQGAVSIIVQSDLVYVNEGGGKTTLLREPGGWLKNRLGFAVPLRSLRYWVLCLPAPDADYQARLGAGGGLAGFEQQGWSVDCQAFVNEGGFALPKKSLLQGNGVTLKLIADEWVLNR